MKKLLITVLLTNSVLYAQTYELYDYTQTIAPTHIIQQDSTTYQVYQTTYGIQDITPTLIIEPSKINPLDYNIYETTNGIKDILPTNIIKLKDYDFINK